MGRGSLIPKAGSDDARFPEDLRRPHAMSRFPGNLEADYRVWLNEQVVPLAQVVTLLSATTWILAPIYSRWWIDGERLTHMTVISLLVGLPASLGAFAICRWRSAFTIPTMFVAMTIVYAMTLYGLHELFGVSQAVTPDAIMVAFLASVMRFPFRTALALIVIVYAASAAITIADRQRGILEWSEAGPQLQVLLIAFALTLGTSAAGDHASRIRFADERLIARQRRLLDDGRWLLRRYVPPRVVDRIESGRGVDVDTPARQRVTVLFSDVVGFTRLADRLDPEALTEIVHDYLAAMADAVDRHGGTLTEFLGDGVMAVFGAPDVMDPERQVEAAIEASWDAFDRLPALNESWFRLGSDEPLQMRIGINTGVLSVGTFGSAGRATYTAIGLQANIASRIEGTCHPGELLISHASWQLVKASYRCEERGAVEVKGVHYPIKLYRPVERLSP